MSIVQVGLGERSYPIAIEKGCLSDLCRILAASYPASGYCLVADATVATLYGERLLTQLEGLGVRAHLLRFPAGEASKSLTMLEQLARSAARLQFDRNSMVIALGGGVTGDLAGFLASTYLRGVSFLQIPTSLLAQVDSSVGGKTGVDLPEGKNLLGTFYQPLAVFIDPVVLRTLPEEQLRNGLAEVLKHGVIKDREFVSFLETNRQRICDRDEDAVGELIHKCCQIKATVVAADEREGGVRRILNFGHTIGHAVESASDFTLLHGFAVAIGMVAAVRISLRRSLITADDAERIITLIRSFNLPTEIPADLDRATIKTYLFSDKKRVGGKMVFILPVAVGDVIVTDQVTEDDIDAVLAC